MSQRNANVKKFQEIRTNPIVQLSKYYYRRSKKHMRRDERFVSLAQIDKLGHELK